MGHKAQWNLLGLTAVARLRLQVVRLHGTAKPSIPFFYDGASVEDGVVAVDYLSRW
jgi:hypothetical protein